MEWTTSLKKAINFIEKNLDEEIDAYDVAENVHVSPYYFQKGFSLLTGYSITEYIRNRRLYLASLELISGKIKVIDAAFKYGYETPESFTKAFSRFHGVSPLQGSGQQTLFAKEKTVVEKCRIGEFGICIDDIQKNKRFNYMIAGRYDGGIIPDGMTVYEIPAADWAKFRCVGPLPGALQSVNTEVFKTWLPGNPK